jgi:DNA-binding NtrC family response regulator
MKASDFTLLIAEDDPSEQLIYQKALSSEGYRLVQVESGSGMLAQLKEGPVDLLITDLKMGPISGLDALSIIQEKHPALPIIVVSGYYKEMLGNFNEKVIKVEAFFQKPLSMKVLKEKILEILKVDDKDRAGSKR